MNPIQNQAPIFPSKIYIHNIHRIQRLYYFGILLKRLFEIFKDCITPIHERVSIMMYFVNQIPLFNNEPFKLIDNWYYLIDNFVRNNIFLLIKGFVKI